MLSSSFFTVFLFSLTFKCNSSPTRVAALWHLPAQRVLQVQAVCSPTNNERLFHTWYETMFYSRHFLFLKPAAGGDFNFCLLGENSHSERLPGSLPPPPCEWAPLHHTLNKVCNYCFVLDKQPKKKGVKILHAGLNQYQPEGETVLVYFSRLCMAFPSGCGNHSSLRRGECCC